MGIVACPDVKRASDKRCIRISSGCRPNRKGAMPFQGWYIEPVVGVLNFHQTHFPVSREIDGIGQSTCKLCQSVFCIVFHGVVGWQGEIEIAHDFIEGLGKR